MQSLKAPFPWFGSKSRAASLIWQALGDVETYVEPFAGSLAALLARPLRSDRPHVETVNDLDGYLANFWRAVQADPDGVARWADSPVNELDLHARHAWLLERRDGFAERLRLDPDLYDVQMAGWWVWGVCAWIGSGWCRSASRQLPHLSNAGRGVHRPPRQLPDLDGAGGKGVHGKWSSVHATLRELAARLRHVRVACGDWSRVVTPSVLRTPSLRGGGPGHRPCGVLLDPPYAGHGKVYGGGGGDVSADVRAWAIEHGDDPHLRIVLCGYDGEHAMPAGWRVVAWKANGGYGSQGQGAGRANAARERLWLSPHCLPVDGQVAA